MIIHLTKLTLSRTLFLYEAKSHFFLGFEREADTCNCFRRSRFMLANNLRVGTR
jgi:hypothetical protein